MNKKYYYIGGALVVVIIAIVLIKNVKGTKLKNTGDGGLGNAGSNHNKDVEKKIQTGEDHHINLLEADDNSKVNNVTSGEVINNSNGKKSSTEDDIFHTKSNNNSGDITKSENYFSEVRGDKFYFPNGFPSRLKANSTIIVEKVISGDQSIEGNVHPIAFKSWINKSENEVQTMNTITNQTQTKGTVKIGY